MIDFDCPKCKARNSVQVGTASVIGKDIYMVFECKKCGEESPTVKNNIDTLDIKDEYTKWIKSY